MPERSEWLVAEGGAKRNPRYRHTHHDASERRENRLPRRQHSRPPDAFHGDDGIPGVSLRYTPGFKHSGFALGIQPFRLDTLYAYNAAQPLKNRGAESVSKRLF